MIRPAFHHVNLKTTRLQEMIDFYRELVGAVVANTTASLMTGHFPFPHAVCIVQAQHPVQHLSRTGDDEKV